MNLNKIFDNNPRLINALDGSVNRVLITKYCNFPFN